MASKKDHPAKETRMPTAYADVPIMHKMSASHPLFQKLRYRLAELSESEDWGLLGDPEINDRYDRLVELTHWVMKPTSPDAMLSGWGYRMQQARLELLNESPDFWAAVEDYEAGGVPLAWLAAFVDGPAA